MQASGDGTAASVGLDAAAMARLKEAEDSYVRDELVSKQLSEQLYDNLQTIQRYVKSVFIVHVGGRYSMHRLYFYTLYRMFEYN